MGKYAANHSAETELKVNFLIMWREGTSSDPPSKRPKFFNPLISKSAHRVGSTGNILGGEMDGNKYVVDLL